MSSHLVGRRLGLADVFELRHAAARFLIELQCTRHDRRSLFQQKGIAQQALSVCFFDSRARGRAECGLYLVSGRIFAHGKNSSPRKSQHFHAMSHLVDVHDIYLTYKTFLIERSRLLGVRELERKQSGWPVGKHDVQWNKTTHSLRSLMEVSDANILFPQHCFYAVEFFH